MGYKQFDNKRLVTTNSLPEWATLYLAGAGDTASAIGGGTKFQISCTGQDDTTIEFQFCDQVHMVGGFGVATDALLGDYVDFKIYAPATTITAADPENEGNCNSVPTGQGFNIIVPAAGNGAYDVDLDNDEGIIVPNTGGTGYWDWDAPNTGMGTVTPNYAGAGAYDLYPVGMNLSLFTSKLPLLGCHVSMDFSIPNVRSKMMAPHWKGSVTLHSDTASNVTKIAFFIKMGRARSFINPVIS